MIQDFGGLNCIRIHNMDVRDFDFLKTIDTKTDHVKFSPYLAVTTTTESLKWGAPVALLGKLFMDGKNSLSLRIKDIVVAADSSNSLKMQIKTDNRVCLLIFACSLGAVVLASVLLKEQVAALSNKIKKILKGRRQKPDWEVFEDEQLCTVCYENTREILFNPCKHFLVCRVCYEYSARTACMMCRRPIQFATTITSPYFIHPSMSR